MVKRGESLRGTKPRHRLIRRVKPAPRWSDDGMREALRRWRNKQVYQPSNDTSLEIGEQKGLERAWETSLDMV